MSMKKIAAAASAALLLASTAGVAQASSAQSLSLSNARVSTTSTKDEDAIGSMSPLIIIGGIIGTLAILEITGVIDIFSDSP
ncbi:hypothetical protein [Sphingomonas sp.]|uniref:hypothetical protein n=1 Tax=Sphingomonas sp. TaxID=28214 RepID=UPI001EC28B47|nr:hypothetical protein [Sphingomonas sp.]MBX3592947.1 hypothetical protein [Sphingomonas sp.]